MAGRIALISDLHGNLQALEAVLADLAGRGITRIFNLGDLAGKGPDGAAVIDLSRKVCEITVQGNWDAEVARHGNNPQHLWHRAQLGPEGCDWLAALPGSFDFVVSGQRPRRQPIERGAGSGQRVCAQHVRASRLMPLW